MFKRLHILERTLVSLGAFKSAQNVAKLASETLKGVMPSFDWLKNGLLMKQYAFRNPLAFEEFVEENSDILSRFDVVKYLGSGKVGDVWLLEDGMVLKIFDARAEVFSRTDLDKYEELMEMLFEGDADPGNPMVYEVEEFRMTPKMYNTKSPSDKNIFGYFKPGYAIIEKVKNYESMIEDYTKQNEERFEIPFEYDEEGDIINEPDEEEIFRPISREDDYSFPDEAMWDSYEYSEFLKEFLAKVMHGIIFHITGSLERYEEGKEYEEGLSEEELKEHKEHEGLSEDDTAYPWDLDNPSDRRELAESIVQEIDYGIEEVSEETLGKVEEMLGLQPGWLEDMAITVVENYAIGRKDLHAFNFGFRGGKIVFFDA